MYAAFSADPSQTAGPVTHNEKRVRPRRPTLFLFALGGHIGTPPQAHHNTSPLSAEEGRHLGGAFRLHHTATHLRPRMERLRSVNGEAAFDVWRTVDDGA